MSPADLAGLAFPPRHDMRACRHDRSGESKHKTTGKCNLVFHDESLSVEASDLCYLVANLAWIGSPRPSFPVRTILAPAGRGAPRAALNAVPSIDKGSVVVPASRSARPP